MSRRTIQCFAVVCGLTLLSVSTADAKPKSTKAKKKSRVTTTAAPRAGSPTTVKAAGAGGGARNFSCKGSGTQLVTERIVTGTVDPSITITNVTVTQTHQLVNNTLVEQPVVVLMSAKPPGTHDPASDLIVFRLNERRTATADDLDKLLTLYQLNFHDVMPPGPTFDAGLYFSTLKGAKGAAANEVVWQTVSSLAYGGAYSLDCKYT